MVKPLVKTEDVAILVGDGSTLLVSWLPLGVRLVLLDQVGVPLAKLVAIVVDLDEDILIGHVALVNPESNSAMEQQEDVGSQVSLSEDDVALGELG